MSQAQIPIVGQRLWKLVCREGHYEETSSPFQMIVPAQDGSAVAVRLCRVCWLDFISTHCGMREATAEEADQIHAQGGLSS